MTKELASFDSASQHLAVSAICEHLGIGNTGRMWTTFLPDILVAVFGAALTVAIAFLTVRRQQRQAERNELNGLIRDLHHRRALCPVDDPGLVPGAKDLDDFKHANLSVLDIRNQAKLSGREILPDSPAQTPLSQIISACNEYLENSMYAPDEYYFGLMELRGSIHKCVKAIAATDAKVTALEPGMSAFTRASQQPVAPPNP